MCLPVSPHLTRSSHSTLPPLFHHLLNSLTHTHPHLMQATPVNGFKQPSPPHIAGTPPVHQQDSLLACCRCTGKTNCSPAVVELLLPRPHTPPPHPPSSAPPHPSLPLLPRASAHLAGLCAITCRHSRRHCFQDHLPLHREAP